MISQRRKTRDECSREFLELLEVSRRRVSKKEESDQQTQTLPWAIRLTKMVIGTHGRRFFVENQVPVK